MGGQRRRVLWLIWDAAADWAVERLLAQGALPNLAALAARGARARLRPPAPNCQTPPALACLVSGARPAEHGVTGYVMPDRAPGAGPLDRRSGFDPAALRAEPIWRRAAAAGLRVAAPHMAWAMPTASGADGDGADGDGADGDGADGDGDGAWARRCALAVEAYSGRVARGGAATLGELAAAPGAAGAAGARLLEVAGAPVLVRPLRDGLEFAAAGGRVRTGWGTPRNWRARALDLGGDVACYVWAFRRPPGGEPAVAHSGAWRQRVWPPALAAAFAAAAGPFCGEGLGAQYRVGTFGPRLIAGGDGRAESLFWRSLMPCAAYFGRVAHFAAALDADLCLLYQPYLDDVGHEIMGWCDTGGRAFRPAAAARLWRIVRRAYQYADAELGRLARRLGDGAAVVVASDHGVGAVARIACVNEALRRAGLVGFDDAGGIDLARTRVFYHPANNGLVCVNGDDRPGGIVPASGREAALAAAAAALAAWRDDGGRVLNVLPGDAGPGWRRAAGELFVTAADGYDLHPGPGEPAVRPAIKSAQHVSLPGRRSLLGVLFAAGPGMPRGDLGELESREVHQLVADALGL